MKVMKIKKVKATSIPKRKNKNKTLSETHRPEAEEVDFVEQNVDQGKKVKLSINRKKKNKDKKLVGKEKPEEEGVDLEEKNVEVMKVKKEKVTSSRKRKKKDKHLVGRKTPEDQEVDLKNQNVDQGMQVTKVKKVKVTSSRKRKNNDKDRVGRQTPGDVEVDLEEQNDGVEEHSNIEAATKPCRSKEAKKKRRKEVPKSPEKIEQDHQEDIHIISSGDDDSSSGMKKWIMEYHRSRPGMEVLRHKIEDFLTDYEEKLEEERKAKEARLAEGGWTVVVHHKGRKKTTDSESGIAVGSVAQAAAENKIAKKKHKEVGLDFYRFQKKEAQRNDLMLLQSKFEEDKKRLQQLRAARKFRPY